MGNVKVGANYDGWSGHVAPSCVPNCGEMRCPPERYIQSMKAIMQKWWKHKGCDAAMVNLEPFMSRIHKQLGLFSSVCDCLPFALLAQFPLGPSYIAPNMCKPHMAGKWLACTQATTCSITNNLTHTSFACVEHTEYTEHAKSIHASMPFMQTVQCTSW